MTWLFQKRKNSVESLTKKKSWTNQSISDLKIYYHFFVLNEKKRSGNGLNDHQPLSDMVLYNVRFYWTIAFFFTTWNSIFNDFSQIKRKIKSNQRVSKLNEKSMKLNASFRANIRYGNNIRTLLAFDFRVTIYSSLTLLLDQSILLRTEILNHKYWRNSFLPTIYSHKMLLCTKDSVRKETNSLAKRK